MPSFGLVREPERSTVLKRDIRSPHAFCPAYAIGEASRPFRITVSDARLFPVTLSASASASAGPGLHPGMNAPVLCLVAVCLARWRHSSRTLPLKPAAPDNRQTTEPT